MPGPGVQHGVFHEGIPVVAGLDHDGDAAAGVLRVDREPFRGDLHYGAGEPVVGHEQVGAAAEDQQWLTGSIR